MSRSGESEAGFALLCEASSWMEKTGRLSEQVLIEIEKCRHFMRHGRTGSALNQGNVLLSMASKLDDNPIGKAAILEMIRRLYCGDLKPDSVQIVMKRVRYPNLRL